MNNNLEKYKKDIDSQVDYASRKYGGNLPSSVARAHAISLATEAMKNYDPSKGNVKTYLSKRLQKLSRIAYKASTPLLIPESRLMNRSKIRDYVDEHVDTFGHSPTHDEIAKNTGVSKTDAKNYLAESASVSNESGFDNIHSGSMSGGLSSLSFVNSIPTDLRGLAEDIYLKNQKESNILKKHKIGRTSFFAKKKKIDNFIKDNMESANIVYN